MNKKRRTMMKNETTSRYHEKKAILTMLAE
jgi:hypothetical protein